MLTRSLPILAGAALLLALPAACDRQTPEPAQPAAGADADMLAGVLDRSFAGRPIPEVTVRDPAGKRLDLAETDGRPVLLNLWATWCAPCVVEMPLLDELAEDFERQLSVVTVSEDMNGAEAVVPFFEANDLPNLPRWMDPGNELAFSFGGGAVLPLTILYDAEGREVWRVIGAYDWGSEEARAAVSEGLSGE